MPPARIVQLDGRKWRQTHQATVDGVLGSDTRKVTSKGSNFFNTDNWTARSFASAFCKWARLNADHCPDRNDLEGILRESNQTLVGTVKGITIASTPDDLPRGLALALVGGGYHEAWHTRYSRTTPILMREITGPISKLWGKVPYDPARGCSGWASLTSAILTWSNIVEDIIIERRGCLEYPGAPQKMEALQDLILDMENTGKLVDSHRTVTGAVDVRVVVGAFRDLGLGYKTPTQMKVLAEYQKLSPKSWSLVTKGALKPLLERTIAHGLRGELTGLESLWLAMEIVATLWVPTPPAPKQAPPPPSNAPGGAPSESPEAPAEPGEEPPEPGEEPPEPPPSGGAPTKDKQPTQTVFKVGDRAKLAVGPFAGRSVEVTRAGLPDKTGVQPLEYKLLSEDEVPLG